MITVDIVSPVGGRGGGIENVIVEWTKNLNPAIFHLRVFHLHSGMAYLNGYPNAYCINKPFEKADLQYCVNGYELFIREYGAPDICIATNWPMMSLACDLVRQKLDLQMTVISWVHSKIDAYEDEGLGSVTEMLHADIHFAINGQIQSQILKVDSNARVYLIGNPVKLQTYTNYQPDPLTLAYVGRFSYSKRIDIILEAIYKASAPWKLKIIGDGEIKEEINSWVKLLKLEKQVEMLGWQENPWEQCHDASILLMASEYEGFGLTAFEASSLGMTVISTPVDGITDYIVPGENGYLFPYENADQLAYLLNCINTKALPLCDPETCRNSVQKYSAENYFQNVQNILLNSKKEAVD